MPDTPDLDRAREAAREADWMQVVLNGGPPCFHLEGNTFCLRAERWAGHYGPKFQIHVFVSLEAFVLNQRAEEAELAAEFIRESEFPGSIPLNDRAFDLRRQAGAK